MTLPSGKRERKQKTDQKKLLREQAQGGAQLNSKKLGRKKGPTNKKKNSRRCKEKKGSGPPWSIAVQRTPQGPCNFRRRGGGCRENLKKPSEAKNQGLKKKANIEEKKGVKIIQVKKKSKAIDTGILDCLEKQKGPCLKNVERKRYQRKKQKKRRKEREVVQRDRPGWGDNGQKQINPGGRLLDQEGWGTRLPKSACPEKRGSWGGAN